MKKNQSGVSLIALVITIIVVIILAAVAFSSSTDTITNANYSTFTNNVGEVRTALATVTTTVKGQEAQNQVTRTDSQVYNFVAKGGTLFDNELANSRISGDYTDRDLVWLPRAVANNLACTQLNDKEMKDVLDMTLPNIKVNTDAGTGKQVSYFVTREGTVFVWPPYEYENEFYVNDTQKVMSGDTSIKADSADAAAMYPTDAAAKFTFKVGNVDITVMPLSQLPTEQAKVLPDKSAAELQAVGTVFYTDAVSAQKPVGLESTNYISDAGLTTSQHDTYQIYSIAGGSNKVGAIESRNVGHFEHTTFAETVAD